MFQGHIQNVKATQQQKHAKKLKIDAEATDHNLKIISGIIDYEINSNTVPVKQARFTKQHTFTLSTFNGWTNIEVLFNDWFES